MLEEIYYNIGVVEVEDQIDVTNQLINLYPFIGENSFLHLSFVTPSVCLVFQPSTPNAISIRIPSFKPPKCITVRPKKAAADETGVI